MKRILVTILSIIMLLAITTQTLAATTVPAKSTAVKINTKDKITLRFATAYPWVDPNDANPGSMPDFDKMVAMEKQIFALWNKKYPNIQIKIESGSWGDDARQKVLTNYVGNTAPDIIMGEGWIKEFARLGMLAEIPDAEKLNLAPASMSGCYYNGKYYGVSNFTGIFQLYINKKVLKEAGIDSNSVPKTWSEWLSLSKKVSEVGNGKLFGTNFFGSGLGGTFHITPIVEAIGAKFMNENETKATLNTPQMNKALTFLRNLSKTGEPGSAINADQGAVFGSWHSDKVAFIIDGPWRIAPAVSTKNDFATAVLPTTDSGKKGNIVAGNAIFSVINKSKYKNEAIEFLKFLSTKEIQLIVAKASSRIPTNKSALADPSLEQINGKYILPVLQDLKVVKAKGIVSSQKNPAKFMDILYNMQQRVFGTNDSIATIIKEAQTKANEVLK